VIKGFVVKNCLSFDEARLEFEQGLTVFSGPSGAGKSVLMNGLLASFGLSDSPAVLCESVLSGNLPTQLLEAGIENEDDNVFRFIRKEKVKLLINGQNISKKALSAAMTDFVVHLSSKDGDEFGAENLLAKLDLFINDSELILTKDELSILFLQYETKNDELNKLIKQEQDAEELKEFLHFEIQKIESINPKIGEDEELLSIRKLISKKEKTEELLSRCQTISTLQDKVLTLFEEIGGESDTAVSFFAQLNDVLDSTSSKLMELDSYNIDSIMARLEELSSIKKRYGGIEEALEALSSKKIELKILQNIEVAKSDIEAEVKKLKNACEEKANRLSSIRKRSLQSFSNSITSYLEKLYMSSCKITINQKTLSADGIDALSIQVGKTEPSKLSAGEYRRARLALMCVGLDQNKNKKILIVDEADANVSGEESAAIAKTLKYLSKSYQIFAISHQPQLSALADKHFLVVKTDEKSKVKEIMKDERAMEIARIVSGETITKEAIEYAKKLLKEPVCL